MRPLRICMVTTFYPPYNFGGDGVYVQRLAEALARDGHEIDVIHDVDAFEALGGLMQPARENPSIRTHPLRLGKAGKLDLLATHQLGRPLAKRQAIDRVLGARHDVIHFHNISLMGGPAILRRGTGTKICTLHDFWYVCEMHVLWKFDREACTERSCFRCTVKGRRPPQLWRFGSAIRRSAMHVDAFLTGSEFSRRRHIELGFPSDIQVLPLFAPDSHVQSSPFHVPGTDRRPYFLYIGRLERLKGVENLLEVFRGYRGADLVIAGTGTLGESLRTSARDLDHVRFAGWLEPDELRALYANAAAVIVPSLCYETFGLVALEAFGTRTPVIARNIGALPEVLAAGGGMLFDSDDELPALLDRLLGDQPRRDEIGEAGFRSLQQNYTEALHLDRYYEIIENARDRRSHPRQLK
ncbi:MAG TPA: glycosyltransferase family 4 protein [Thermoanaerobaculia bacterium]|nr:glycosyltransferase family 4 protein [Thermoanaerobaculia bacterium]